MIDFSVSNKLTDDTIVTNDLLCVLQQIDMLFGTIPGEILGDIDYGTNYDKYLYSQKQYELINVRSSHCHQ